MEIVKKANNLVLEILTNSYQDCTGYKPSIYNVCLKKENIYLVYSTLTNGLYLLDFEEYETLTKNIASNDEIYSNLVQEHLIVPDNINEYLLVKQLENLSNLLQQQENVYLNSFTILTTTKCNARCFYCYENGIKKTDMNLETAETVAKYIINNCNQKEVVLKWFGGEPLFNAGVIECITEKLKANGVSYTSYMISNGYLFSEKMVLTAIKNWNLKKVQITLDGTESIYNKYKAFIYNCDSPFRVVTDNIERLIDSGVTVNIRLNMDYNNSSDLFSLVEWISNRYPKVKNLHIYPAIISDNNTHLTEIETDELMANFEKLTELICLKGFSRFTLDRNTFLKHSTCMANNPHAVVITPDGKLQRCEHISDDEVYGDVWSDVTNSEIYKSWLEFYDEIERCETCEFFPCCRPLKKCKTFVGCTSAEIQGRFIRIKEAMMREYQEYIVCKSKLTDKNER